MTWPQLLPSRHYQAGITKPDPPRNDKMVQKYWGGCAYKSIDFIAMMQAQQA